jgi:hypothetical protein
MKEQKARREALAKELAEKTGKPVTDFARLMHLEGTIESSVADVDNNARRLKSSIIGHSKLGSLWRSNSIGSPSARSPFRRAIKSAGEVEGKLEGIFLDSDQRSMARDFSMDRW